MGVAGDEMVRSQQPVEAELVNHNGNSRIESQSVYYGRSDTPTSIGSRLQKPADAVAEAGDIQAVRLVVLLRCPVVAVLHAPHPD